MRFPWVVLAMLGAGGCRDLLGIDPSVSGGLDGPAAKDAERGPDAPPGACEKRWLEHTVQVTRVAKLDFAVPTGEPVLSRDMLTLYMSQSDANRHRIVKLQRPSVMDAFPPIAPAVTEIRSGKDDLRITFTADDKTALLTVLDGVAKLYLAHAADGFLAKTSVGQINGNVENLDGAINADGTRIYYARTAGTSPGLFTATSAAGSFDVAQTILSGIVDATDPAISLDERILLFTSGSKLFYMTRPALDVDFDLPVQLADVLDGVADPFLSSDYCTLFYAAPAAAVPSITQAQVLQ